MVNPAPGGSKSAVGPGRVRQLIHLDEASPFDPLDHQLGEPVPPREPDPLPRVVVDHDDLDLTAVAGVDRAGRIHQRHPAPGCQSGTRVDEGRVPQRQRDRSAGRHDSPLARRQINVDRGHQIGAGVTIVGVRRAGKIGVEPPEQDVDDGQG